MPAPFDEQKKRYLASLERGYSGGKDRSKKGGVDEQIMPLLEVINAQPDLYTTSSCAGRIHLFVEAASGKKHEGEWLFVSHDEIKFEEIEPTLKATLPQATLWFRMEGAILHICCRDLESANAFLQACKESGWKHSGITGTAPRVMIEATTDERMDVPIAKDAALFVPTKFVEFLVKEANAKLGRTREKIARLEKSIG